MGKPFPVTLGECEGDCDEDDDCKGTLKCFQRSKLQAVPGCSGASKKSWDYCYDAAKLDTSTGTSSDLDVTGFVIKTRPSLPSDQKIIESTGAPGTCLEAVQSDDTTGLKGLKKADCVEPPTSAQMLSAADLP